MIDPIEQYAADAIISRMWAHTIGVVNEKRETGTVPDGRGYDAEQPGSASMIRWDQHHCILTAKHVLENADKNDLRFFFRPTGILDRGPGCAMQSLREKRWDVRVGWRFPDRSFCRQELT